MLRRKGLYQCRTCGGIVGTRARRAHLTDAHHGMAEALTTAQVSAAFTTTIDIMHPGRAAKWGYPEAEIRVVIPGLQPAPEEERSDG